MKFFRVKFIIGLSTISMLGLVIIQVYWVARAIEVNRETFSRGVNEALMNVTHNLERKDAFTFVSKKSFKDTVIIPNISVKSLSPGALRPYMLSELHKRGYQNFFFDGSEPNNYIKPDNEEMFSHYHNLGPNDTAHDESVPETMNRILKKKYLLQKLAADLARRDNPIEQRCDYSQLNLMLKKELSNEGIDIPYKFGVYEQNQKKYAFSGLNPDSIELKKTVFKAQLFPDDFFLEPNFLRIYFPGQQAYLLKQIVPVLSSSLVFIMIIGLSFLWMMQRFLEQKNLSDMKTDFINNMTHEFKTPITTIGLASEALKDPEVKKDSGRMDRYAGLIYEENRKLEGQVERVLQIAQMDKGKIKLNLEQLDIHELIKDVVKRQAVLAEERSGVIKLDPGASNSFIFGDAYHITNILDNLIDNANKYSPGKPEIVVKTYNIDDGICVEISDHGIGILPEDQKKIFDKFYRVPTGNVHNVKGFGLGLNYVKTMVETQGGSINVKSTPGSGSIFTLILPIIRSQGSGVSQKN